MRHKSKCLVAVLFLCTMVFGQRQPDEVIPFTQDIQQIIINPTNGHVIVKEKDAITSRNPATKAIDWTVKKDDIVQLGTLEKTQKVLDALSSVTDLAASMQSADAIEMVPNSPYIRSVIENRDVIINSLNGKVAFNSGNHDYRVMGGQFLPADNEFLLLVSNGKVMSYVLWNLQTNTESWKTDLGEVAGLFNLKALLKVPTIDKTTISDNAVYATMKGGLYKMDRKTGKVLWQGKDKIYTFYPTQSGNDLIVIKNTGGLLSSKQALNIWKTSDGTPFWKDDIVTKYIVYLEDWNNKLLVAYTNGFNFYAYADGKKIWKKDPAGSNIKRVIPVNNDYLYIAGNTMNLINGDGANVWKNTVEISDKPDDAVHFLGKIENNRVLYLTATDGNMVDYGTGKKIWKKNVEFDKESPLLYSGNDKTNTFFAYNYRRIYKFDPNSSDKPEPAIRVKDIKDDMTMSGIDLFDWGVCLTGQSEVAGVNFDGSLRYHNKYKEPGGTARTLMAATAVGLGAANAISQTQVEFSYVNSKGERVSSEPVDLFNKKTRTAGEVSGDLSNMLSQQSKRFNALKQNEEYAFLLNKGENGPELVKVRKGDGKEIDKIGLSNNKPVYEVDPQTGTVYYAYKNELRIFK